jgi:cell division protein FtsW (lipid II flippase)
MMTAAVISRTIPPSGCFLFPAAGGIALWTIAAGIGLLLRWQRQPRRRSRKGVPSESLQTAVDPQG